METIELVDYSPLPSGENSSQVAVMAKIDESIDYEILSDNKNLEYIDYLNMSTALRIIAEFFDVNCTVITNENLICSASLGANLEIALTNAIDCDPVSSFNATAAFSKEVDSHVAKLIVSAGFKNVVAPGYSKDALTSLLDKNINILVIKSPLKELLTFSVKDIKVTPFGALVQEQNFKNLTKDNFQVVTKTKPTQQQVEDAIFAWKISKHLKSRSAVIAKDLSTKAIIQSKPNSLAPSELALDYACETTKDAVMALDGAIDSVQIINSALQARIGLIIETGMNKNRNEIAKLADKYSLAIISTGLENNKY